MTVDNPMTEETRNKILEDSARTLNDMPRIVDAIKLSKGNIVDEVDCKEEKKIVNDFIDYLIFYHIFFMDITSIYYLMVSNSGKVNYANLYLGKQYIVVTYEGYRKMINFAEHSPAGKNYFWLNNVQATVDVIVPNYREAYEEILNDLRTLEPIINELRERRHLSVHYDEQPLLCYSMLENMNVNEVIKEIRPISDVYHKILEFNSRVYKEVVHKYLEAK